MLSEREIDDLLRQVGSKGRVVEAATVSPVDGQLMAGDADGLVTGDVLAGGVAGSQKNIVVVGAVRVVMAVSLSGWTVVRARRRHARRLGPRVQSPQGTPLNS